MLWRRSEALEGFEDSRGSKHKALEMAGSYGGGRRIWRRSEALERVEGLWRQ
jgi:hypothetical protein